MGVANKEFEFLEQQFLELIGEFRTVTASESRLREALRTEATRAEAAEAARASAERAAAEARSGATASTAAATQAAADLTAAYDQITEFKIQLELSERQRNIFEEKHTEMLTQISLLEREVQQLRPLQLTQATLQRQYMELQERIVTVTEEARRESSRLESELRRVERCAAAGSEVRDRARLAAAAHTRERRLAADELQHTARELNNANVEISRLTSIVSELQAQLAKVNTSKTQTLIDPDSESVAELRAALQAEKAGSEKLEKTLAAALSDNASLAAQLHAKDNNLSQVLLASSPPGSSNTTNICPIDSFLAE